MQKLRKRKAAQIQLNNVCEEKRKYNVDQCSNSKKWDIMQNLNSNLMEEQEQPVYCIIVTNRFFIFYNVCIVTWYLVMLAT